MKAVVLVLAALVAASFLTHALLAPPDYGRRPRLAAVVDGGKMEEFLESPAEKQTILSWVEAGAPESQWPDVAPVLESRCVSCHQSDAGFEVLPLDNYEDAGSSAKVHPTLREKIVGGTMGEYLETAEAQATIIEWIDAGAPKSGWPEAKAVLDAHCIQCHNPEGVQGIVSLDTYRSVARLASLPPAEPRPVVIPGTILAVSLAALIAIGWRGQPSSSTP